MERITVSAGGTRQGLVDQSTTTPGHRHPERTSEPEEALRRIVADQIGPRRPGVLYDNVDGKFLVDAVITGDMENSDRLALGLFAALFRLVPQDGSGGGAVARLTIRSAEGDFVGELKLPEVPLEVLTDGVNAMVNYVSAQEPGSLDNPYADVVDEYSFRDPELEAAVDAVFAESEQGEL
ncbi:hypothetical protein, partial [Streptomyces capuensis]|uniref:hypothetical protein n=1 Tax=Streptomyces capuensis TaxID=1464056 RepID=UPI00131B9D5F